MGAAKLLGDGHPAGKGKNCNMGKELREKKASGKRKTRESWGARKLFHAEKTTNKKTNVPPVTLGKKRKKPRSGKRRGNCEVPLYE